MSKCHKKLTVCHVNVRSLLSPSRLLDVDILTAVHNIDVLCLSETWLSALTPTSYINLNGFYLASRRDRQDRRGGGVAIFVRNHLIVSPLSLSSSTNIECTGVQIALSKRRKLNIITAYRPPDFPAATFIDDL